MTDNERILREASAWVEQMNRPVMDIGLSATFDAWMAADERHADAFARLLALWDGKEIEAALAAHPAGNDEKATDIRRPSGLWRHRYLAAAASVVLVVGAALPLAPSFAVESYHAGKGRAEHIALADGTQIDLAPDSDLSVQILPWARKVKLAKGEAYFDVQHEKWRSFTVGSEAGNITVLGTAFNVDLEGRGRVAVQVYRGAVSFRSEGLKDAVLRAGFAGRLDNGAFAIFHFDAADRQPDWQDGWFIADNAPLGVVVEKANRYTDRPIVLLDRNDLQKRVSGRFRVSDRASLLMALQEAYDVKVR